MKQQRFFMLCACFCFVPVVLESLIETAVLFAYSSAPQNHCIDLSFSKHLEHCGENEEEGIPRVLQNLINWEKERHAKPLMIEIMSVNVSTEKDSGLIQIGPTLSSARAICRFLKNFQKQNVLRGPVKTCVESLLRLCSLGSLSASRLNPFASKPWT